MKIVIDTSAFMSYILKTELDHKRVTEKYKEYNQQRSQFITSNFILDELFTRCLASAGAYHAKRAIELINGAIRHNELNLLEIDPHTFKKAQKVFLKFSEHKISFTDATTYVLYKDFKLDEIFTLDSDFKKMRAQTSF